MWIKGGGVFKQHRVGVELVLLVVLGEGEKWTGKDQTDPSLSPTISELGLESTISTGGASLEGLRCSGLDWRCLRHLWPQLERQHGVSSTQSCTVESVSLPLASPGLEFRETQLLSLPKARETRRLREDLTPKPVQKNPGQNREDPIGVGTQVQIQGLKPRGSRG